MKRMSGAEYAAKKYIELPVRYESTIMEFLMKEMAGVSRNRVKDLLRGHAVSVDRKLTTLYNAPVKPGETVRVNRHKRSTELQSRFVKIVYEDKDIIVIEKPSGMLSVPYPGSKARTALDVIEKILRGRGSWSKSHRPFVVHRLDRDTSGVMVFALSEAAQRKLVACWHDGNTRKVYRAVAENPAGFKGRQEGGQDARELPENGTIDQPLAENAYHVAYVPGREDERRLIIIPFQIFCGNNCAFL